MSSSRAHRVFAASARPVATIVNNGERPFTSMAFSGAPYLAQTHGAVKLDERSTRTSPHHARYALNQ